MIYTKYEITTLANGIRIISEDIPHVHSVSIGIWIGAGSRYENEKTNGISHFMEHLLFKGTERRTAKGIAEELDSVGGQINAFTSRENTCYYARVLDEHVDLAIDVLADMFYNSKFAESDIDKERGVILEEINMYEDTPDELIHDYFTQKLWPNSSLGHSILGPGENIKSFSRNDFLAYKEKYYIPERIVISVAGNITHQELVKKLSPYFSEQRAVSLPNNSIQPKNSPGFYSLEKDTSQIHLCMGVPALKQDDPDIYTLFVMNTILGGGFSSRLVQKIREEKGLAYSVYTYQSSYSDSGYFAFYGGISPENFDIVSKLMKNEAIDLVNNSLLAEELEKAKNQMKGNYLLNLENVSSRMFRLGRSLLTLNKVTSPEEVAEKIDAVSAKNVQELAAKLFADNNWTITTIGPKQV